MAAMNLAHKIGYLRVSDLTGPNNSALESQLEKKLTKRVFRKGDTVYPTRSSEPTLFLVKSGSVSVYRNSASGSQFDVKKLGPGMVFGEMPLLGQSMLGAHATADEKTEVLCMSGSDFEAVASATPAIAINMLRATGPRLVDAERRHEQAAFQPVTSRIASLLLKQATKDHQVVGLTHQDLADTLGVYRETVTNALAELKQDKLIKIGRKRLELTDIPGLRRLESF
jgi:CRP-like cAMP-binding protein